MSFSGLRVLFIGIGFYDYEQEIVNRIETRGGIITCFTERPLPLYTRPWGGLLAKFPSIVSLLQTYHEKRILKKIAGKTFDKVLMIKANDCNSHFLEQLRHKLPNSEFILYQWDSLTRFPGVVEKFRFFNRILSFDRKDVQIYPIIKFRPLFYRVNSDMLVKRSDDHQPYKYDLLFVGLMHSTRLAQARVLQAQVKAYGLKMHMYLVTNIPTWIKLWLKGQSEGVHLKSLSYKEVIQLNRDAGCVLDLPHPDQTGLTMRAIESIGFEKKIITTGKDIQHYDFFDPHMIHIIDMDNPTIDIEFLKANVIGYSQKMKDNYSMDIWLDDVFFDSKR